MDESVPKDSLGDARLEPPEKGAEPALPSPGPAEPALPARPQVTFRGNTYDLMSLGSLATAALLLFLCVTCNMGYYCLPLISLVLGAAGLLGARQSVEMKRTRLWSWLDIAAGGVFLLLIVLCFILYFGFLALMIITAQEWG